nr:MAG TPA: hypothetical protein [Bacteriophage sp.]
MKVLSLIPILLYIKLIMVFLKFTLEEYFLLVI